MEDMGLNKDLEIFYYKRIGRRGSDLYQRVIQKVLVIFGVLCVDEI